MLFCPLRGFLAGRRKQTDLSESEELRRIEIIQRLLEAGVPRDHIQAATVLVDPARGRRPSLRADVAVYDRPVALARRHTSLAGRRRCLRLVARAGRDGEDPRQAKDEQLRPALTLIERSDCLGLYWDETAACVLVKQTRGTSLQIAEHPVSCLRQLCQAEGGDIGCPPASVALRPSDLSPAASLVKVFVRLEELLQQAGHGREERQAVLAKLLLMKLRDEQRAMPGNSHLIFQDLSDADLETPVIQGELQGLLEEALRLHGDLLLAWVGAGLPCSPATLSECCKILSPVSLLGSSTDALHGLFVHLGRSLYRVDLGHHFTPFEVLDLILQIVNPRPGERLLDPACATADFLVAARRQARDGVPAAQLHGVVPAEPSVKLSRLHLLLNGGQDAQVAWGDSLKTLHALEGQHSVVVCSPPFGVRMLEKRPEVLQHFALAALQEDARREHPKEDREDEPGDDRDGASLAPQRRLHDQGGTDRKKPGRSGSGPGWKAQETGLLFGELCLRAVAPGGRVGLILPNGYLGNRGPRYVAFRRWLLCHARIAAVIGFPRFTFKRAGADVSASAVILERRAQPLTSVGAAADYPIYFDLLDKVGWDLQRTPSVRLYKRNPRDGVLLRDADGGLILDADFERVLRDLRGSAAARAFPWMREVDASRDGDPASGGVQASTIWTREDLCLDPKRWCPKHARVVAAVRSGPHLRLGDVLRPVVRPFRARPDLCYDYVEIEHIDEDFGLYRSESLPGWQLPRRARLCAAPGDLFIANIWSSAGKWMMVGADARAGRLVVTNGCTQFESIPDKADLVPDVVFGLSSEAFRVQMRARASGSDGLSWVATEDITSILLPCQPATSTVRAAIEQRLKDARAGRLHLPSLVSEELARVAPEAAIPKRCSHTAQV